MANESTFCLMESMVKQTSSMEMLGGMSQTCPFCGEDTPHCMIDNEDVVEDIA